MDSLQLHAPATPRLGRPETVAATLKHGSRTLPVKYLVGAVWSGSPGLHVGRVVRVRPWHVAWLDPRTGLLTALRPGQIGLSVTVNGVTSSTDVRVSPV
ncbi:hypothetical protein [Lentzea nigeriaca]|uniref:hypothetical protein n=1 Tax=Lentzea nigeriaca TaxID=1128665 RepID=UPI00195B4EB7|nr:hypothetical protein [Lentzea nigeriaca]MBM7863144.1 hypothetical protein [Lentzea nigeriaca]